MSNMTLSGDAREVSRAAGSTYHSAIDLSLEDGRNGLGYVLLRLSVLGLTKQDQDQLRELAQRAYQELDVAESASRIRMRESASPLAVAIADIVDDSPQGRKRMAMAGAVFGAYVGLVNTRLSGPDDFLKTIAGVLGAMAGAIAVSTSTFIQDEMEVESWRDFVERPKPEDMADASRGRDERRG